jgi:hypothetical protein
VAVYVFACVALFCAAAYFLGRTDGVKTVTICPFYAASTLFIIQSYVDGCCSTEWSSYPASY